jgi:riboflavin synthase
MFSGLVEECAEVVEILKKEGGISLTVRSELDHADTKTGDSIAILGVCLTVTSVSKTSLGYDLTFDVVAETLRKTSFKRLVVGARVNFERSLIVGSRNHGHFVYGHVDGVGRIIRKLKDGDLSWRFTVTYPQELRGYLAPKGSITISGVSLTIGEVRERDFTVYIVPHTYEKTTFGKATIGDTVHLEVDMLARYVASLQGVEQEKLRGASHQVSHISLELP